MYDGLGFPAALQFKVIFASEVTSRVSFSGSAKVGGSENEHNQIKMQSEVK